MRPPENPLDLGTLYVSNPLQRKEKVHLPLLFQWKTSPVHEVPPRAPIICAWPQIGAHGVQAINPPPWRLSPCAAAALDTILTRTSFTSTSATYAGAVSTALPT